MALRQSPCFVLRTHPVSETARVVVLFSAEEGKIKGWAHGARRPNSRFGSSMDLGNEVQVEWQERQTSEWVSLRHGELLTSALPLVRDPVTAAALRHLIRLVDLFAPDQEANPDLYRLTRACLGALLAKRPALVVTAYFEAWLLRLSGLYPRPGRCGCGVGFDHAGAVFHASGPAWSCPDCASGRGESTARLSSESLALLERFWASPPDRVRSGSGDGSAASELFRFHGLLTEAAVGHPLEARAALASVLRRLRPSAPAAASPRSSRP